MVLRRTIGGSAGHQDLSRAGRCARLRVREAPHLRTSGRAGNRCARGPSDQITHIPARDCSSLRCRRFISGGGVVVRGLELGTRPTRLATTYSIDHTATVLHYRTTKWTTLPQYCTTTHPRRERGGSRFGARSPARCGCAQFRRSTRCWPRRTRPMATWPTGTRRAGGTTGTPSRLALGPKNIVAAEAHCSPY